MDNADPARQDRPSTMRVVADCLAEPPIVIGGDTDA
jgi:hypothetical protein